MLLGACAKTQQWLHALGALEEAKVLRASMKGFLGFV